MFYFLDFTMGLDNDRVLEEGRLVLRSIDEKGNGRTHTVWVATTSTSNKQKPEDFHQKGGVIPPEYRAGIRSWTVQTTPIPMPQVKGVEGSFYKIDPHIVTTDKGGVRGDFGVHLDANAPGSLGCIVMNKERFASFEKEMTNLKKQGVKQVPLFVTYSTN